MNEIIHKNIFLWSGFCRTFPSSWAINLFLKTTKPKHWPFDKNTLWQYHLPLTFHYWVDYTLHIQTEKKKKTKREKRTTVCLFGASIFSNFLFIPVLLLAVSSDLSWNSTHLHCKNVVLLVFFFPTQMVSTAFKSCPFLPLNPLIPRIYF